MRVLLDDKSRCKLAESLRDNEYSHADLSHKTGAHSRTVYDWLRGKYTIPEASFDILIGLSIINKKDLTYKVLDNWWNASSSGKIAGISFKKLGKTLGSVESRRRAGVISYESRRKNADDIFTRSPIKVPSLTSTKLSEYVGIIIGDGSITKYQVKISSNYRGDEEYTKFLKVFLEKLFGAKVSQTIRPGINCTVTTISSIELVKFTVNLGLPQGHKIRHGIDVPSWIKRTDRLASACLRGIFDTDGSIFYERHTHKNKSYSYPRMSFVNASEPLLKSVYEMLVTLGFQPKRRYRRVNLERFTDIERYFTIVGSNNSKHIARYYGQGEVG